MTPHQQSCTQAVSNYLADVARSAPRGGSAVKKAAFGSRKYSEIVMHGFGVYPRLTALENTPPDPDDAERFVTEINRAAVDHVLPAITPWAYEGNGLLILKIEGEMGFGLFPTEQVVEKIKPAKRVQIFLDSAGGDCRAALDVWAALEGKTVECIALSRLWSAATIIFCAGQVRRVCADTTVMVHQPLMAILGTGAEAIAAGQKSEELVSWMRAIYGQHVPKATVNDWLGDSKYHWLTTAAECLACGLATEIIPDSADAFLHSLPGAPTDAEALLQSVRDESQSDGTGGSVCRALMLQEAPA